MTEHASRAKRASSIWRAAIFLSALPPLTIAFSAHSRAASRYPRRAPAWRGGPVRTTAIGAEAAPRLLGVCGRPVAGALAFSADGKRLAVGSGSEVSSSSPGEVRVWDVQSGRILYTVPYPAPVSAIAYAPLADNLAVSTVQSQVTLWSATTGTPLRTLPSPHATGGLCLAFSPNGDVLATGGGDLTGGQFPGEAHLWSVRGGGILQTAAYPRRSVVSLQFSPRRGDCLIASRGLGADRGGAVDVWDHALRARRWSRPASDLVGAAIVDGGATVAGVQSEAAGKEFRLHVRLWTGASGTLLGSYVIPMGGWAVSPDGRRLACADADRKSVAVRDARTGTVHQKLSCDYAPARLTFAFSPDGSLLAAGTQDGMVILWTLK